MEDDQTGFDDTTGNSNRESRGPASLRLKKESKKQAGFRRQQERETQRMGYLPGAAEFDGYYSRLTKRGRRFELWVRDSWSQAYGVKERLRLWAVVGRLSDGQDFGFSPAVALKGALRLCATTASLLMTHACELAHRHASL